MRFFVFTDFLRGTGTKYFSSVFSAFRTNINNVIGNFNNIHIVLDYDYGVSFLYQFIQYFE